MSALLPSLVTPQAAGTSQSGTGALTVAWPTHVSGDGALLVIASQNEAITLSTAAGFVQLTNSPQNSGGVGLLSRLAVFWCTATSGAMASPVVAANVLTKYARIYTFRNCTDVQPVVTAGGVNGAGTAVTGTGSTALAKNCLIAQIVSYGVLSTTPQLSGWANSNLGSVSQFGDESVVLGCGIGVATGTLAAGGAWGNTTATLATSANWAALSVAFQPVWMVDATAGVAIPQSSSEYTAFLAAAVTAYPVLSGASNPGALYKLQEASGNPVDSIGGFTLTATGSPGYAAAVSGWATKGISFTDGLVAALTNSAAGLPDLSSASLTSMMFAIIDSAPSVTRTIGQVGTANVKTAITSTPRLQAQNGNTVTSTVYDPTGQVRPYTERYNFTASTYTIFSDQEKLSPAWIASTGKRLRYGGATAAPACKILWACAWLNASAELTDDQVAALYIAHGFIPVWDTLGILASTLAGATVSSAGTVEIQGALAKTLAGATVSSAGTVDIRGVLAKTLAGASTNAVGTIDIQGVLAKTLAGAVVSASGTVEIQGVLAKTLADASISAAGTIEIQGLLTKTLAGATVSAVSTVDIQGILAKTLAGASTSAAGTVDIQGVLAKTLAGTVDSDTGTVEVNGILNKTLDDVTVTIVTTITTPITGILNRRLNACKVVATGTTDFLAYWKSSHLSDAVEVEDDGSTIPAPV